MQLRFAHAAGRVTLDALVDELAGWRRYGRRTAVGEYDGVFANEFWTSKQRAAHSLHEVSDVARGTPWTPVCIVVNEQAFTKTSNT